MAFELPALPYAPDALEPHIDAETMRIHHGKHHRAYVDKLNVALAGRKELLSLAVADLLSRLQSLPEDIRTAVRNHGGGHANHALFWEIMSPHGGENPEGALKEALVGAFGSVPAFKEKFTAVAAGVFGSGWAWLALAGGKLSIVSTQNQDSPLLDGAMPLLGVDVWEHAYYLRHQNRRPEYLAAWWNVIYWRNVGERYERGVKGG